MRGFSGNFSLSAWPLLSRFSSSVRNLRGGNGGSALAAALSLGCACHRAGCALGEHVEGARRLEHARVQVAHELPQQRGRPCGLEELEELRHGRGGFLTAQTSTAPNEVILTDLYFRGFIIGPQLVFVVYAHELPGCAASRPSAGQARPSAAPRPPPRPPPRPRPPPPAPGPARPWRRTAPRSSSAGQRGPGRLRVRLGKAPPSCARCGRHDRTAHNPQTPAEALAAPQMAPPQASAALRAVTRPPARAALPSPQRGWMEGGAAPAPAARQGTSPRPSPRSPQSGPAAAARPASPPRSWTRAASAAAWREAERRRAWAAAVVVGRGAHLATPTPACPGPPAGPRRRGRVPTALPPPHTRPWGWMGGLGRATRSWR
jgi:hypothetical protein